MKDPEKARVQTVRVPPAVTTAVMTPALPVSFEADAVPARPCRSGSLSAESIALCLADPAK